MSQWCKKCQKLIYNNKCDFCGYKNEEDKYIYKAPKNTKRPRVLNTNKFEKETITLNKNTILIVATVVIAIGISYLAINKYEENRQMSKLSKVMFGTDDPDKIIDDLEKINKRNNEMAKKSIELINKTMEQQQKQFQKMFKN